MALQTLDDFSHRCGQVFELAAAADLKLQLLLVEAIALPMPAVGARQPFSLMFEGPPAPLLPQCIYRVGPANEDAEDLFLVPVGADSRAVRYQAIFT